MGALLVQELVQQDCVDPVRFEDDLELVSEQRVPGSDHWQLIQDECADRLTELGYAVARESYGTGVNVVGVRPGADPDEGWVIVGAHYDHIPNCSGADDNGSGLAALFEVARILADIPTARSLVVTCWDEEELGRIGSAAQAQAAVLAGQSIAGVINLDSVGVAHSEPNTQVVPEGFNLLFPEQYGELVANEFRADNA